MLLILDEKDYQTVESIVWFFLWCVWLCLVYNFESNMQFLDWCDEVWEAARRRFGDEAAHPQNNPSGDDRHIRNATDGDNHRYQYHGYGDVPTR